MCLRPEEVKSIMTPRMKREDDSTDTCRIVIADDHFLIREGLRSILKGESTLQVVGEAEDGLVLLFLLDQLKPDLVLLDLSMPNLRGIETARLIKMRYPEMRILILTMHQESEFAVALSGDTSHISRDLGTNHLFHGIRRFLSWDPLLQNSRIRLYRLFAAPMARGRVLHLLERRSGVRHWSLNIRPNSLPKSVAPPSS
jgi:CheY-like chemotaxis protein